MSAISRPQRRLFKADETKLKTALSKRTLTTLLLLLFALLMIIKPSFYLDSARRGLSLFAGTVLPSMFPFYFCSIMLTKIGAAKTLSALFRRPMFALYRTPKESAYVMLLSMLSGYPVGAACLKGLYSSGAISTRDVRAISAFASTSGPIFMLGTVGVAIFHNVLCGVVVLVSHYLAAFLNGFIYRLKASAPSQSVSSQTFDADKALGSAMSDTTLSMLLVGGYVVLAGMLADTLKLLNFDVFLLNTCGRAAQPILSLVIGAIEMTRGAIECAKCAPLLSVPLATAVVSFGGLSVTLQTHSFLSACGMKTREILLRKFTHSIIAFALALLLTRVFKNYF